ncbi:MAG: hypothetical protein NVSMB54_28860 [Ktedonobacteraceae bacterium]
MVKASFQRRTNVPLFVRRGILFLLLILCIMGPLLTLLKVPGAEAAYSQQNRLVQRLLTLHAARIYSEDVS